MLSKQISLVFIHKIDDLVVFSYHYHCELSQNSKVFPIAHHELIGLIRYPYIERNKNFPCWNLVDEF